MLLKILPESFITNGRNISDTHNCLICPTVLQKHKETILDNKEGCIFKIDFTHEIFGTQITEYVNCLEFTAPKGCIILSNKIFDKLLIDFTGEYCLNIDVFLPPQATKVIFKVENKDIFAETDIKDFLERGIDKKFKFLQVDQCITVGSIKLKVKELEPYNICLINNTDLEVEFDIPHEPLSEPPPIEKKEVIVNDNNIRNEISTGGDEVSPSLTRAELRKQRLQFYSDFKV